MRKTNKLALLLILTVIALSLVLTACFPETVEIKFDSQAEGVNVSPISVTSDTTELVLPSPSRTGYSFMGWYYDAECNNLVDVKIIPTENATFYAKWLPQLVTITFKGSNGAKDQYKTVDYGSNLAVKDMPAVIIPEGYDGYEGTWDTADLINITEPKTITCTLRQQERTITYLVDYEIPEEDRPETDGGVTYEGYSVYAFVKGLPGSAAAVPSSPAKAGYYFLGWYYDALLTDKCFNSPEVMGSGSLILYAGFENTADMSKFLYYDTVAGDARITGLTPLGKNQKRIVIPDTIDGKTVKYIGYSDLNLPLSTLNVFRSESLTGVIVPSSVIEIGCFSFLDCAALEEVVLDGNSLQSILTGAFAGCTSLTYISIPDRVNTLASYAFAGITTVNNGNKAELGLNADWYAENDWYLVDAALNKVAIGANSSLSNLESRIFYHSTSLTSLDLPKGITELDYQNFEGSRLQRINILPGNAALKSVDGVVYSSDGTSLIYYPNAGQSVYAVEAGTAAIGENAFRGNSSLTTLTLSGSTSVIGANAFRNAVKLNAVYFSADSMSSAINQYAFADCKELNVVKFPSSLTVMNEGAFDGCSSLVKAEFLGYNLETIPKYAFRNCVNLETMALPSSVETVDDYAFAKCVKLTELTFDGDAPSLITIGRYAFSDCSSLYSTTLPSSVQTIGEYAFAGILQPMKIQTDLPSSLRSLGSYAFLNCAEMSGVSFPTVLSSVGEGVFKNNTKLKSISLNSEYINALPRYLFYGCADITNVLIPAKIRSVGDYAFYGCSRLTTVTFNVSGTSGVNSIGESAFENCVALKETTTNNTRILPSTVTAVGKRAFYNCRAIENIFIPSGLSSLSEEVFAECAGLKTIGYDNNCALTTFGKNSFFNCSSLTAVSLPSSLADRENGRGLVENPFSGCVNLTAFSLDGSSLFSIREGIVYQKAGTDIDSNPCYKLYAYPTGLAKGITISTDVIAIDDYAFANSAVVNVDFAVNAEVNGVENVNLVSIGSYAFAGSKIASVTLSKRVYNVGSYAFADCPSLSALTISDTLVNSAVTSMRITDNVNSNLLTLGKYAFKNASVKSLNIPSRVTLIDDGAFSDCYNLNTLYFVNSVNEDLKIGSYAFSGDRNIKTVTLPYQLSSLGGRAFSYCVELTNVVFNYNDALNKRLDIGEYAFSDCPYLYSVTLPGSLNSLGKGVFYNATRLNYAVFPQSTPGGELTIPDYAFYGTERLKEFALPDYVTSIGKYAFAYTKIASFDISSASSLVSIGDYAFANAAYLQSIALPSTLSSIGSFAFYASGLSVLNVADSAEELTMGEHCFAESALKNVDLPSRISVIAPYAFADTKNLESFLSASDSLVYSDRAFERSSVKTVTKNFLSAGEYAFDNCVQLTLTDGNGVLSLGASIIKQYAFNNCVLLTGKLVLTSDSLTVQAYAFKGASFDAITTDNAASLNLSTSAFSGLPRLTEIDIAYGAAAVINEGFAQGNRALNKIDVNDGAANIYSSVDSVVYFTDGANRRIIQYPSGKSGSSFVVPADVTAIGSYAFADLLNLTNVTVESSAELILKDGAFGNSLSKISFYVQADRVNLYRNEWKTVNVFAKEETLNGLILTWLYGDSYAVTNYTGTAANLVIPSVFTSDGKECRIVSVGEEAFINDTSIVKVTLPDSVLTIGKRAFANTSNLTDVTLGKGATSVGAYAFASSAALKNITFSQELNYIGDYAFYNCVGLTAIDLPDSVYSIGNFAFAKCSSLSSLTLGEGVKSVGDYAFSSCVSLVRLHFPASMQNIGDYVIANSVNLSFIYMSGTTVPALKSANAFKLTASDLNIIVPDNMRNAYLAATDWKNHSSSVLKQSDICEEDSVSDYVVESLCNNNYRLISYLGTTGDLVIKHILGVAYYDGETPVYKRLTEIGPNAVNHFAKTVVLEEGILRLGDYSFASAKDLTAVTLPSTLISVGNNAFGGLTKLTNVAIRTVVDGSIKESALNSIGDYAFFNTALTEVILPANLTALGAYAYANANIGSIATIKVNVLPTKSLDIGKYAFANNVKISSIKFPCAVTNVGDGAFYNCTSLQTVNFDSTGSTVTSIDEGADKIFFNNTNYTIFVRSTNMVTAFSAKWKYYQSRIVASTAVADSNRPEQKDFVIKVISGNLASIANYVGSDTSITVPSYIYIGDVKYTITTIGAFSVNPRITTVTLPNTVSLIENSAFRYASALTKVNFASDSQLKTIESYAFANCASLAEITLPNTLTSVGNYAFAHCAKLKNITFEARSEQEFINYDPLSLGNYVLADCPSLTSFYVPRYAVKLGEYAFSNSANLTDVLFDSRAIIETIGSYAFEKTGITSVNIPETVYSVGNYAFSECSRLQYVHLNRQLNASYNTLTTTKSNVFNNVANAFVKVYVPYESFAAYSTSEGWSAKTVIPALSEGEFNYVITSDTETTRTVTLTNYLGSDNTLIIPEIILINAKVYRVTALGAYFGNAKLTKVTFPETSYLASVKEYAFADCSALKEIHLPSSVTLIGANAFANCVSLIDVTLPEGLVELNSLTFLNCSALKEIALPSSITALGDAIFNNCSSLNRLVVNFYTACALGNGIFNGVGERFVIVVNSERKSHFANEWNAYSDIIYSRDEMYGDFVLRETADGFTLVQYTGNAVNLDLGAICIKNKYITVVLDGAIINNTTTVIPR